MKESRTHRRHRKRAGRKPAGLFTIPAIIGLGSGGGRILSKIRTYAYGAYKIAVNNSDRDIAMLRGVNGKLLVGDNTGGSGMDTSKGREDFLTGAERLINSIERACKSRRISRPDLIPVIATLGHGFGSGSFPEALNLLRDRFPESLVMAFAITPFHFQGPEIRGRATVSLQNCRELGHAIVPISNEIAAQRTGVDPRKLGYGMTYLRINDVISGLLTSFFAALSAEEGVIESLDRNDLRQMWQPESILLGYIKYPVHTAIGPNSPRDAEANMFVEVPHGRPSRVYPTTYIIDTGGSVTINQIAELNKLLAESLHADWSKLKPLIIEREQAGATFLLIRGGVDLGI